MPVKIGIVAFAKNSIVLHERPIFSIQSMSGIEMGFSGYGNSHLKLEVRG
jgi:hypothetical protein